MAKRNIHTSVAVGFNFLSFPFELLQISGTLWNTGQSLVMRVEKDTKHHINITGGPLAYRYQFEEIYIHYGTENHQGSEHRVHGYAFPAEVGSHSRPYLP